MDKSQQLDDKSLREFGLLMGLVLSVVLGWFLPWRHQQPLPLWPWIVSAFLGLLALAKPTFLQPIYTVWMKLGSVLGWINTRLILGIIFFIVVMPMGWMIRGIFHRDPLRLTIDANLETYRLPSQNKDINRMENPF
jgi:Saxitoxin biosynthesis operon protein SxtJ